MKSTLRLWKRWLKKRAQNKQLDKQIKAVKRQHRWVWATEIPCRIWKKGMKVWTSELPYEKKSFEEVKSIAAEAFAVQGIATSF